MTVYELIDHLNGEIVSNKGYVQVDGKTIVVGSAATGGFAFTEEGAALAATLNTPKPAAVKRGRNKPADVTGEE